MPKLINAAMGNRIARRRLALSFESGRKFCLVTGRYQLNDFIQSHQFY
ncbi:hypothetical protein TA5114_02304 [Cognatishimia activa]|uniref:Uncharacterized protein n=1 Tax=Cognatishimia activa TaxID=1715691 RepID=A0A0P1ISC0_9RHOB|nr:hypothetical protein TA5113_01131 [Cognatishimia activa]CUK26493.1 hypothetical protein TA5114_02304 [Cognatishimia activa]